MKTVVRITLLVVAGFGLCSCATTAITPEQSAFWSGDEDQYVAPEKPTGRGLALGFTDPRFYMDKDAPDLPRMLSSGTMMSGW
jgi:hypothetical protein